MASELVDLTNCDREPIHIPGGIQPHGCIIVCDLALNVIRRASVNAAERLGLGDRSLIGEKFDTIFGERITHDVRNALAQSAGPAQPGLLIDVDLGSAGRQNIVAHSYKGVTIVEFETTGGGAAAPLETARMLTGRLGPIVDVDALMAITARLLRASLRYDRVMIYQFAADGSGKVISETKRSDLESFSGQHFPASDIPQQARRLYLANTVRVIADANADPIAIEPQLLSGEPLDLSHAHLRAVSPVHCEYLRNMGVAASMSVSIVIDGELWGLIACHHYVPKTLTTEHRIAADLFGHFFAMKLESLTHKLSLGMATRGRAALDTLLQKMSSHLEAGALMRDGIDSLRTLMPCDGVALWIDGEWTSRGTVAPAAAAQAIAEFVGANAPGRIYATHCLSDGLPQALSYRADAAGVLAIPLSQLPRDYLFFFRREVIQTVNWGGDPEKTYSSGPLGDRLTPRKSFAIWKETVERQSIAWTASDRDIAESARAALVEIAMRYNEVLADERRKSDVRQRVLNEELNHRVKNILALINSLVSNPIHSSRDLPDYVASLKGRIQALSFAHDQVVRSSGGGVLEDLLRAELSPYRSESVVLTGPVVQLDARAFSVMALVLHELATNAAKYGALSSATGELRVTWRVTPQLGCEIHWNEQGGPRVVPPSRQGFGSILLSRSIAFDLGGTSTVDYAPDGVAARLTVPARHITLMSEVAKPAKVQTVAANGDSLPPGSVVLLVEDQLIIALEAEVILSKLGAERVITASSVDEAIATLEKTLPTIAMLDINLGHQTSWPIAQALERAGVPFILASGYGDLSTIPGEWANLPIVTKPYDKHGIAVAFAKARQQMAEPLSS